ncbi:MAG: nucleotide sugar dehydrogenase [Thermoanaerobaculia bacterium]
MDERLENLLARTRKRRTVVGVLGLGYVGLPLSLAFQRAGFRVLGYDIDAQKVEALGRSESYIRHLDKRDLGAALASGRFSATADPTRLSEPDALLICVPTPLGPDRRPDLSAVESTACSIRDALRRDQLVVLESTTYPGTTAELLLPILEDSGLRCGEEFFLAYSPEREDPGNPDYGTAAIPKVVGGVGEGSAELARCLYDQVVVSTVAVADTQTAEATKLTENIFRAVNIALVNELKMVYDRMGIDIWEVLDAAATKPFGFMRFDPGPGWGGHCIPIDPFYLSWKARQYGPAPRFVELAAEINLEMAAHVVRKLAAALERHGQSLRGARILVLGLAYKANVADPRESPAFEVIDRLLGAGAEVSYHDPLIPTAPRMRTWAELPELRSEPLTAELLAAQSAVLLITDHSQVDYDLILEHAPLVVDTRGVLRGDKVVRA